MNRSSFTGLAVLAPTVLGGLYWKGANARGAAASIVVGEALVALFYFNVIRVPAVQPVVPVVAAAVIVFAAVSLFYPSAGGNPQIAVAAGRGRLWRAVPFVLANDFWAWGRTPIVMLGLPLWVWYSIGLGLALAAAYAVFLRDSDCRNVKGNRG